MATTIEQQVMLDEALVPSTKRLRIGRSNFRLPSDIQSKESTLQVVYDVLRICPIFKAFLVTADNIVDLETFRDMLHICPRVSGQSFDELPFEEEILDFLRFLGHSAQIKTLTDVNVNKLFQPWRSFAAVINKCLTGKSFGFDSFRLSQAQILWGLFHKRNIDCAFLIWEDFVYQVEHKNQKKSNEMYYPRFTKVIIHHFLTKKPSIPRRNKVNWHYVRDDILFSTIKVAYKEYYACATGEAVPKPKVSARRKRNGLDTSITPPTAITTLTTIVAAAPRLTAAVKGKQRAKAKSPSDPSEVLGGSHIDEGTGSKPGVPDVPSDDSEEEILWNSSDDEDVDAQDKDRDDDEDDKKDESDDDSEDDGNGEENQGLRISEEERLTEEEEAYELYRDSSSVSSQFVSNMLNPTSDAGMESIFATASSPMAPLPTSTPIMTPATIATITTISHAPIPPMPIPSEVLQNLPTFDSVFRFEDRLKSLEINFSEFIQTNQFAEAVSKFRMEGNKSIQRSDEQRNLYKALVDAYEADKTILDSYGETTILKRRREDDDDDQEGPSAGSDRGSKRRRECGEPESASAPLEPATRSAGRLGVDTLTPELLAGPTYELMRGSCNSLTELEYHLEEVYKAMTDQLDWVNPEGQQYPNNLLQPLPLIPDNRGCRVIPFAHFINNDIEYLRGGASSKKYTTYVTKTKAADYGHIMWIEDLVPRTMWIQEPINYDKHALWGVSHWGRKRQQFYGFAVNQESALDVYSKRRIIVVTDLKIMEWHNYKHLDWILRRMEDLQLGVESYQKRLNLMKPDTYRSNLKRREAYTAYSNPTRFIYQNKEKKNRLMWIDELHKFSDGTLNDVRNALDDRLKGIRMQYLPQTIWRKGDKDIAAAMIHTIDKMLKTKRIMRSLKRFVGGRLYEGDFRMLQRII
uniref:Uncharacterized protein n=1 Tax=Tanacetum cinerariifolium TaxID=118510 RepID=A0A699H1Z0_TANCI|nr:hypothetical protein [Tanacetum cinerariifolium]